MPDQFNFGNATFSGGQQSFGSDNTNIQYNDARPPREQVAELLATIRAEHPDPVAAGHQVAAIEGDLADPSPAARGRIEERLRALAAGAGSARTVAEAAAAIGAIIGAHWPF